MNEPKLKIAVSIWSFTPNTGGLQAHAQNLCRYLEQRGHEVCVITRSASRIPVGGDYLFFNEPQAELQVGGVNVRPLRLSPAWSPVLWIILKLAARPAWRPLAASLFELVAARPARAAFAGFDVIHHIGHATALFGFAAAQAAKYHHTPFVVQPTAHPLNFGDDKMDIRLYEQATRLLVHSKYEQDYFVSKGIKCPVDLVYNGIEDRSDGQAARFRAKYEIEDHIILYLGRKAPDKGYPLVVEAFKLLHSKYPRVTLVCMGPTDLDYPRNTERPVPGVLELDFAAQSEKHDALAACTFLCVPSEGESFGLVYMEAGRYKKPVIGRKLPVLEELLGQESAGLLLGQAVPGQNKALLAAPELAEGMAQLLAAPQLCEQMGAACFRASASFLWPKIVRNFETSYLRVLEKPAAPGQTAAPNTSGLK